MLQCLVSTLAKFKVTWQATGLRLVAILTVSKKKVGFPWIVVVDRVGNECSQNRAEEGSNAGQSTDQRWPSGLAPVIAKVLHVFWLKSQREETQSEQHQRSCSTPKRRRKKNESHSIKWSRIDAVKRVDELEARFYVSPIHHKSRIAVP